MSDQRRTGASIGLVDDLEVVRRVDELGYDSLWTGEGQGRTAFGKLERWATVTDDVHLATGIVNVFSRSPAAVAQAIATLDAHSDERAILGLGTAHPGVIEAFHGVEFDRPLARMAEYIRLVKRYLTGDPEDFDGDFFTPERTTLWDAFDLPRADVPIYNAALGPRNVELAGELADGWFPYLYPVAEFEHGLEHLAQGAERAGRDVSDVDVAMYALTSVDEDREEARRSARNHIATYLRGIPGYYGRVAADHGFEDEMVAVRAADSTPAGAKRIGDEFLDTIALAGTPDEVDRRAERIYDAGANLVVVRPPLDADSDDIVRTLEVLAP